MQLKVTIEVWKKRDWYVPSNLQTLNQVVANRDLEDRPWQLM